MTPDQQARQVARSGAAANNALLGLRRQSGGQCPAGRALERLDIPPSKFTRQGLDRPDDAAVLDPRAGTLDVLSVDFFPAFMDDPYLVGRVAALNALSDLWSHGLGAGRGHGHGDAAPGAGQSTSRAAASAMLAGGLAET